MNDTYLKLSIGGLMGVCESMFGGNMLESLKIIKQNGIKYNDGVKLLYQRNGLYSLLYTAYFPYGIFQSLTRGIPFFYASMEVKEYMTKRNYDSNITSLYSGFIGGIAQGIFISPTQRIKTLSLLNKDINIYEIIKKEKLNIFKGTSLICLRRSLDWSLRLVVMDKLNINNNNSDVIISSFIAGLMGIFTLPIDVIIARTQNNNMKTIDIIKTMIKNEGFKSLSNGLLMRTLYSGWHTMWVAGVGTILYNKFKN